MASSDPSPDTAAFNQPLGGNQMPRFGGPATSARPPTCAARPWAPAARSQLKQGRLDGSTQGSETVACVIGMEEGAYKAVGTPFGGAQHGIAFTTADTQLRDAVLGAFKRLLANGTYAQIIAKWALQTSAVKQAGVNGVPAP